MKHFILLFYPSIVPPSLSLSHGHTSLPQCLFFERHGIVFFNLAPWSLLWLLMVGCFQTYCIRRGHGHQLNTKLLSGGGSHATALSCCHSSLTLSPSSYFPCTCLSQGSDIPFFLTGLRPSHVGIILPFVSGSVFTIYQAIFNEPTYKRKTNALIFIHQVQLHCSQLQWIDIIWGSTPFLSRVVKLLPFWCIPPPHIQTHKAFLTCVKHQTLLWLKACVHDQPLNPNLQPS